MTRTETRAAVCACRTLALGSAQYIASDFSLPGLPGLLGNAIDLACDPAPGATTDEPRFTSHGQYQSAFVQQAHALAQARFLLAKDAAALIREAAASNVGKAVTCSP